jgi:hypothetical protein
VALVGNGPLNILALGKIHSLGDGGRKVDIPLLAFLDKKRPHLLQEVERLIAQCADSFSTPASFARDRRHCLSQPAAFGRHTITGLLRNQNRTQQDWTADYRLYTESRLDEEKIVGHVHTVRPRCGGLKGSRR